MGGAEADPQTCEIMSLALRMPIFENLQLNKASGENFKQKLTIFTTLKVELMV